MKINIPLSKIILLGIITGFIILSGNILFPKFIGWIGIYTDEARYVATAYNINETGELLSATHFPQDIIKTGTEHKPVHMPLYMIVMAIWLKIFPHPISIITLNQILFIIVIFLMWGFITSYKYSLNLDNSLLFAVLITTPLAFVFSNFAMRESFVLFVGTLTFISWFAISYEPVRFYLLYCIGLIGFITSLPLLLLTMSILITHPREIIQMHLKILGDKPFKWLIHIVFVSFLIWIAYICFTNRGFYPNFITKLRTHGDIINIISLVLKNLVNNLDYYFSFKKFPHDIMYFYYILIYSLTIFITIIGRNTKFFKLFLTVAVFWSISLIIILCLYDNFIWRSHRVFMINSIISTVTLIIWLKNYRQLANRRKAKIRMIIIWFFFLVHTGLVFLQIKYFQNYRNYHKNKGNHILTQLNLAEPGDLALVDKEDRAFQFLVENLQCQVIRKVPKNTEQIFLLIKKAKPRFVLVKDSIDLGTLNYIPVVQDLKNQVWVREE
ncbi:hypothetical protein ACFLS9_09820 [Bacteroidota bacterium]